MSAWPSSICTTRRSAPWLMRWVANAWRNVCGEMGLDFGLRERLGKRARQLRRLEPRGRIVVAQSLAQRELVEALERGDQAARGARARLVLDAPCEVPLEVGRGRLDQLLAA